jgi:hypothetical protein
MIKINSLHARKVEQNLDVINLFADVYCIEFESIMFVKIKLMVVKEFSIL